MKKILLSLTLIAAFLSFSTKALADACGVSNLVAQITGRTSDASCSVNSITFNLEFDATFNNGQKFVNLIIWQDKNYPNFPYTGTTFPTQADLTSTNAFGVISLKDGVSQTTYQGSTANVLSVPAANVIITTTSPGHYHWKIFGIQKVFSTCPVSPLEAFGITADVWASNAGSNNAQHCATAGLQLTLDDPVVNTIFHCGGLPLGRTYDVQFINNGTSSLSITYDVYVDNGNGTLQPGTLNDANSAKDPKVMATAGPIPLTAGQQFSATNQSYPPYSTVGPYRNNDVFIVAHISVSGTSNGTPYNYSYDRTIQLDNACAALPVKFKSVDAKRSNASNVSIAWTTASEQNNRGFNVQKNVNGEWKTIAFVFSQAPGGNSTSDLSYSYIDPNNEKGISQYRVQQVDLDGKFTYSEIRAIRGEGSVGKIVIYPNPSTDGKVNVVFEDNSAVRDVIVNDMQGRIVQSFKGITNNILVIDRLASGFYTIKVTNRTTAASSVQKVVIK
jgi:hypothetical protein